MVKDEMDKLKASLLSDEQADALARIKQHSDFNDLAQRRELGQGRPLNAKSMRPCAGCWSRSSSRRRCRDSSRSRSAYRDRSRHQEEPSGSDNYSSAHRPPHNGAVFTCG